MKTRFSAWVAWKDEETMCVDDGKQTCCDGHRYSLSTSTIWINLDLNKYFLWSLVSMIIISVSFLRDNHSYLLVTNRCPTFMSDIMIIHQSWVECSYVNLDGNSSYIYNINAKGYKLSNDTAFMWHSRFESCQSYKHKEAPFWWNYESLDFDLLALAR